MKQLLGKITHFFPNIMVAIVKVEKNISIGDKIVIEGHGNSFEQEVSSMQIEKKPIKVAKKGQEGSLI